MDTVLKVTFGVIVIGIANELFGEKQNIKKYHSANREKNRQRFS